MGGRRQRVRGKARLSAGGGLQPLKLAFELVAFPAEPIDFAIGLVALFQIRVAFRQRSGQDRGGPAHLRVELVKVLHGLIALAQMRIALAQELVAFAERNVALRSTVDSRQS